MEDFTRPDAEGIGETNIVFCNYDEEGWDRGSEETTGEAHVYKLIWKVMVNEVDMHSRDILNQLRGLQDQEVTSELFDPIPRVGWYFGQQAIPWAQDANSYCTKVDCRLIDNKEPTLWRVTADYGPVSDTGPQVIGRESFPQDPLHWPIIRWLEIVEDQEVVEVAHCFGIPEMVATSDETTGSIATGTFESLTTIMRGPDFRENEPGPVSNSAGQQTIDPQMEMTHKMIYNVRVNYPTEYFAMKINELYSKTVHAPDSYMENPLTHQWDNTEAFPLIMGMPHGSWKFLAAIPEPKEYRPKGPSGLTSISSFVPTVLKFEIKFGKKMLVGSDLYYSDYYYSGWNRLVLNNGQACFKRAVDQSGSAQELFHDPRFPNDDSHKLLFPTMAWRLREGFDVEQPTTEEELLDQFQPVETSEPINLKPDGTQHDLPGQNADHIWYNNLQPANYFNLTNYYGKKLIPLVATAQLPPPPPWNFTEPPVEVED